MAVIVIVIVVVAAPVAVTALVNGNATVDVIARARHQRDRATAIPWPPIPLIMLAFQKLDVYERSIEFLAFVHRLLPLLPKGHADLADQLRRSAQSTPQNIAEGAGRTSRPDKAKHYTIARGSAMESAAHLDVMKVAGWSMMKTMSAGSDSWRGSSRC